MLEKGVTGLTFPSQLQHLSTDLYVVSRMDSFVGYLYVNIEGDVRFHGFVALGSDNFSLICFGQPRDAK